MDKSTLKAVSFHGRLNFYDILRGSWLHAYGVLMDVSTKADLDQQIGAEMSPQPGDYVHLAQQRRKPSVAAQ